MEKKLALQDIIDSVNHIATALTERINAVEAKVDIGFTALEKQAGSLERRFGVMEADIQTIDLKIDNNTREIYTAKERFSRIEFILYNVQKDADAFHGKMRGIHKVIDRFDGRVIRLEAHAGFPTGSEED